VEKQTDADFKLIKPYSAKEVIGPWLESIDQLNLVNGQLHFDSAGLALDYNNVMFESHRKRNAYTLTPSENSTRSDLVQVSRLERVGSRFWISS
jgi:hypothetical protein